ncbi:trypsin-like peptidase domain-containing protein [Candidatus Gracilibacteria bacterium]|nr:trypsin-like peptidase domain-containing protein [Candidatus Gracilibacteria bacterium]
MRQIIILISISLLLTACMQSRYETMEIIGKESQTKQVLIRGMGVMLPDGSIFTSAHVVRDDRLIYETDGVIYRVWERDTIGDRAILSQIPDLKSKIRDIVKNTNIIRVGDPIYTEVTRSGSIVRIAGKVVDPSGVVTGYDTTGRVMILSGIVLTDISLLPGDSGSPIFTHLGELIDVVHVR